MALTESMLREARQIAKDLKRPCYIYEATSPDRYIVRPVTRGEMPEHKLVDVIGVSA